MTVAKPHLAAPIKQLIKDEASRLGFVLAGFTTPDTPSHLSVFENWLKQGRHATMNYLADARGRVRRADPRIIMPECKSILVLAAPYSRPTLNTDPRPKEEGRGFRGRIAAYAWGADYHTILPERLRAIVAYIEAQVAHPVSSRCYTDTGPILERDLAQRAGLGWIGKNTCLINPKLGSYFLLAEILLDLDVEPDAPFSADRCGTCTRCIEACPTECILPDRTIDAGRCISYLTIELKDEVSSELRPKMGDWIFGCDLCQMVCPWNRFALPEGDSAFGPREGLPRPALIDELDLTSEAFSRKFKNNPVKRAKKGGYLRNVAVALGNVGGPAAIPTLQRALEGSEEMVRKHAAWALAQIAQRMKPHA